MENPLIYIMLQQNSDLWQLSSDDLKPELLYISMPKKDVFLQMFDVQMTVFFQSD